MRDKTNYAVYGIDYPLCRRGCREGCVTFVEGTRVSEASRRYPLFGVARLTT
jgi:hypothetical protein